MSFHRALAVLATLALGVFHGLASAGAVEAVNVRVDAGAIDLTAAVEFQHTDGERVQVSTAPGADGIVRLIEVRAREAGSNWAVFALANNSDEQIDRLIVAPHYRMVGSGLIWPDLGLSRIINITPSSGDAPERLAVAGHENGPCRGETAVHKVTSSRPPMRVSQSPAEAGSSSLRMRNCI